MKLYHRPEEQVGLETPQLCVEHSDVNHCCPGGEQAGCNPDSFVQTQKLITQWGRTTTQALCLLAAAGFLAGVLPVVMLVLQECISVRHNEG